MTTPPSPRPHSITLIAILFILVSLYGLSDPRSLVDLQIITNYILPSGWPTLAYSFLLIALSIYVGVGLWLLREIARRIAIALTCWWLVNLVVGTKVVLDALLADGLAPSSFIVSMFLVSWSIAVIIEILALWFLTTRKAAFGKAPMARKG